MVGFAARAADPEMRTDSHQVASDLRSLATAGAADAATLERLAVQGIALLPALEEHLASGDLPIAVLERYEAVLKAVLRRELAGGAPVSGETARAIAAFQLRVGLLMKYKSYAVKASSPLGYSLFLQSPGEGFSFQRHLTHKVEVFHILAAHPGGFVYLCSHDDWQRDYERERFSRWLAGAPDPAYDRHRIPAAPGDVFILDQLNIVHTVVGCILEEFATISTDMVDRLHDQNEGRAIPAVFGKHWVADSLSSVRNPPSSRVVAAGTRAVTELPRLAIPGGSRTVLAEGFVTATQYEIEPRATTEVASDPCCAVSLYVRAGQGRVLIGDAADLARPTPPGLAVRAHDLLTIPHGIHYALVNEGTEPLQVVEHKIRPEVAFF
jgi:mannose-6-phosphate isomerase-like protein (cupin superfamily)